jgi:flagellar protein FlgJ
MQLTRVEVIYLAIEGIGSNNIKTYGSPESASSSSLTAAQQASDNSFEKLLQQAVDNKDDKELKAACKEFEGVMLNIMYKQMKATVIKSDLIAKDAGTEYFEGMLDDNLMDNAAKTGSMGLADVLYKQLSRQYNVVSKTKNTGAE